MIIKVSLQEIADVCASVASVVLETAASTARWWCADVNRVEMDYALLDAVDH